MLKYYNTIILRNTIILQKNGRGTREVGVFAPTVFLVYLFGAFAPDYCFAISGLTVWHFVIYYYTMNCSTTVVVCVLFSVFAPLLTLILLN